VFHIIGLGTTVPAELGSAALSALAGAQVVMGSKRQLATVEHLLKAQRQQILPALDALRALADSLKNQTIAVLASGDPLFYGIGGWFAQHYETDALAFYPAVSSIQAACHQLGLSLQDVDVLSLHGRPLDMIRRKLKANRHLVILTDQHSQPQILAKECLAAGFADSKFWVCENIDHDTQQTHVFLASDLIDSNQCFDPLHVTIIHIQGAGGVLPEFPGIPDERFVTDGKQGSGMLSKREVRLAILSLLQPSSGEVGWDIGAGCGGVAVEWAYWNESSQIHAVEHHPDRLSCLQANRSRFGVVGNLHIVAGRGLAVLDQLPHPDKVFIGGSDGELEALLDLTWQRLSSNGVLLASAVTEQTKHRLIAFSEICGGQMETVQVAVSKGEHLAGQIIYRPQLPVTLFKFSKPHHG